MKKISIILAALAVLSVSAMCPANNAVTSMTTTTAEAQTFTMAKTKTATAFRQSASSNGKVIKTLPKGTIVQVFGYKNGYSYVGLLPSNGLGWVKSSDLLETTCYR